ncbi:hypothetical protein [Vulcanisaeta sp. JCM 14467]|uniref:hypothetical protein n=1 Tax=Vulcanisaeta sp. JCM 14467 TaxID=1295370 RepID=UPI0020938CD2|nr:hypothetical protein [Vulcanisaeta sp. JCM 14467]
MTTFPTTCGSRRTAPVRVDRDSFNLIDKIYTSITPSSYYLDAMQLGMKFDDDNGTAILGYTLYSGKPTTQP